VDGVGQEHQVAVDVGVDEAGGDEVAGGIEYGRGRRGVQVADGRDGLAEDADVGPERRGAGAVDHAATLEDEVEFHGDYSSGSRGGCSSIEGRRRPIRERLTSRPRPAAVTARLVPRGAQTRILAESRAGRMTTGGDPPREGVATTRPSVIPQ
jgi:hypothetical protein